MEKLSAWQPTHLAWRRIVEELEKLKIDINEHNELTDAICAWGERYAELISQEQRKSRKR